MGVSTGAAAVVDVGAGVDSVVGAGAGVMVWTVAHPVPRVSKRARASMPNASRERESGGHYLWLLRYGLCWVDFDFLLATSHYWRICSCP